MVEAAKLPQTSRCSRRKRLGIEIGEQIITDAFVNAVVKNNLLPL